MTRPELGAQWRGIETAPKDGREILMAYGDYAGSPPLVVAWSSNSECWLAVGVEIEVLTEPTHWMPLPPPPDMTAPPTDEAAEMEMP